MKTADLIWLDPGVTTGVAVAHVDPFWLVEGAPDWSSLGDAVKVESYQIGHERRVWNGTQSRKVKDTTKFLLPGNLEDELDEVRCTSGDEVCQTIDVQGLLNSMPGAAFGVEGFVLRVMNSKPELLSPVRLIAMFRASEMIYGNGREPFQQLSSYALTTGTDERLQSAGLWRPGMRHANDATAHAMTFLRDARVNGKLRRQAWPHLFGEGGRIKLPEFEDAT